MILAKLRARWRLAGYLADAEAEGATLISIPKDLQATVMQLRWRYHVERAQQKWQSIVNDVPLSKWQETIAARTREWEDKHGS